MDEQQSHEDGQQTDDSRSPEGDVADWFRRGQSLLEAGSYAAAAQLLARAHEQEPQEASITEALARAYFNVREFERSQELFEQLAHDHPDNDYAQFGWGISLSRMGCFTEAVQHLEMARAMNPQRSEYQAELKHAQATLRAREKAAQQDRSLHGGGHFSEDHHPGRSG